MHTYHELMQKGNISLIYTIYFEKPYAHSRRPYQSIMHIHQSKACTSQDQQYQVYSSQHAHQIIEHLVKTTLSSSYNSTKHGKTLHYNQ